MVPALICRQTCLVLQRSSSAASSTVSKSLDVSDIGIPEPFSLGSWPRSGLTKSQHVHHRETVSAQCGRRILTPVLPLYSPMSIPVDLRQEAGSAALIVLLAVHHSRPNVKTTGPKKTGRLNALVMLFKSCGSKQASDYSCSCVATRRECMPIDIECCAGASMTQTCGHCQWINTR